MTMSSDVRLQVLDMLTSFSRPIRLSLQSRFRRGIDEGQTEVASLTQPTAQGDYQKSKIQQRRKASHEFKEEYTHQSGDIDIPPGGQCHRCDARFEVQDLH